MKKTLTFKAVSIPQFDEFKKLHNQFILKKCPNSKDFNIESILVLGNCEKKRHL